MIIALCYGAGAALVHLLILTGPRLWGSKQKPYVMTRRDYFAAQLLRGVDPKSATPEMLKDVFRLADNAIDVADWGWVKSN